MQRYLIKFAYSGIRFRGLQKQPGEIFNEEFPCRASIQTIFEKALLRLRQYEKASEANIQFSSRTDRGVHSFCNVAHFDLTLQKDGSALSPHRLMKILNTYCEKSDISLSVSNVEAVPSTFHSRYSSFYRHYLYRIAVTDKDVKAYPIVEWKKCYFIPKPFCLDKAVKACQLFEGTKDFASFCHHFKQQPSGYPTIRTLDHFYIKPGRPLFDPVYDPLYSNIEFYDFHVKARSFMYKQVRRMVSVVLALAQGRMDLDQVRQLFEQPGEWNPRAITAPPYGLYLLNVDYKIPQDEQPQRPVENQGKEFAPSDN
ncbi:tRNA pseudouridine synthase-like 1 [Daphnia carinata]|uniref:tRNA pseudouridine synthase-like 1 n=1 Tax=Daphnia carinata TaxID=120202 RepID=UPI00257D1D70|nr:tRNA pseudouridine synthase-like 1 [Daphnia carinata]